MDFEGCSLIIIFSDKMYEHAQKTHQWSKKRKESWRRKHPESEDSTLADSESVLTDADARARDELHPLDLYDYGDVPAPQLGGQCRLVCVSAIMPMLCLLISCFPGP